MLFTIGARLSSLLRQAVFPVPFPGPVRYLRRLAVMAALVPLLVVSQAVNWLCLWLDEILFPAYRRLPVPAPIFVLGVPRSGTTFMHRLLAQCPDCTTFSTWECLLAPSITQRYFWRGLAAIDRVLGRPAARLLSAIETRMLEQTGTVHPTGLFQPEEDYFCFMPLLSCFILILPFPESDWLWRMARFDRDLSSKDRIRVLGWYRRCLQRHLYFHGADKRMLSKNASFAGMAQSLAEDYPDSRLVICERDIDSVLESQFRSLAGGMRLFAARPDDRRFRDKLTDCIMFYYANLELAACSIDRQRVCRVPLTALSGDTRRVIGQICDRFGLQRAPQVDNAISAYESAVDAVCA